MRLKRVIPEAAKRLSGIDNCHRCRTRAAVTTDSRRLAEPVIGPATSGRTRWLGPGMTR